MREERGRERKEEEREKRKREERGRERKEEERGP